MTDNPNGTAPRRPNVVYIHSHDTGRYVQPYGHAVETPNIQRLAEQGVLFRQAFTAAPTCSPSRAALLTGQSPHSAGMLGLAHRGFTLHDPGQHLANVLKANGYATALAGVSHVNKANPAEIGYEIARNQDNRAVAQVAPSAAEIIREIAASDDGRPFFLDAGFFETHRVYPKTDPATARYVRPPAPLPDTPRTRQDMADYRASVKEYDRGVGIILDALDEAGVADSTIVINTTDHGLAFPFMKCNVTDHGTGVMLVMRGPGGFAGGKVVDALISQVDVFPTLCDVLGIERPAWSQGTSFLPVVRGERDEINEQVFAEVTYHAAYEPQRAVRTRRWLYVRRFGDRALPVLPNCDDGASRDYLLANGWADRPIPFEQLYDNLFDPNQACNLAADPAHAEVLADLAGRLDRWMRETDDPLLAGAVPLPPGASMNPAAARSFSEGLIVAGPDGQLTHQPNPRTIG